jgi:hypothetical protein
MTTPGQTVSSRAQMLGPALTALLVMFTLSPFADVMVGRWPLDLSQPQLRFQTFGLFYAAAPQATVGLVLLVIVGLISGYRLVVRGTAIAGLVLAACYLVVMPFFGLDFLQVMRLVAQTNKRTFELGVIKTTGMVLVLIPLWAWAGITALKVTGRPPASSRQREKGEGLIVAQDVH